MSLIDHKAQAQSRVYAEYRNKTKILEWIGITGELANQIEDAYFDITQSYDIDNAETDQLDIIGRIVVIGRSFEATVEIFPDMFGGAQFGNAQFKTGNNKATQELSDDIYRLLIKAKISKNTNDATLDGIINALSFIVATNDIMIDDHEDMSFDILFDSLTATEKTVLNNFDIIPKPQGVRINKIIDESAVTQFGRSQFGGSQFAFAL